MATTIMFISLHRTQPALALLAISLVGTLRTPHLLAAPVQAPAPGVITSVAVRSKVPLADIRKWATPDVRSQAPKGAVTVFAGCYTIGGEPTLVHLWTTPRAAPSLQSYGNGQSPFCIDLLRKYTLDAKKPQWHVVISAIYLSEGAPTEIDVRYFHPAKKQGLALVLYTPVYMTSRMSLIAFPQGANEGSINPVKDFYGYGPGGGSIAYKFGVDSTDTLNLAVETSYHGMLESTTRYSWKDDQYVASPPVKAK